MSDPVEQATPQIPAAPAAPWAPPSAPPFGAPVPQPGYAPPAGYGAPPVGYPAAPQAVPGYAAPTYAVAPVYAAAAPDRGRGLGVVALILALAAAVGASVVGAVAGYSIGVGVGSQYIDTAFEYSTDLSIYSPVRGWVLLGEIAFWVGTVLGVWALVQGIIAAVKRRGRGVAIAAVVVAALGPIVFFGLLWAAMVVGMVVGAPPGA